LGFALTRSAVVKEENNVFVIPHIDIKLQNKLKLNLFYSFFYFQRAYKKVKIPSQADPVGTEYQIRIRSLMNGNFLTAEKLGS
jgi:hypothetical protein